MIKIIEKCGVAVLSWLYRQIGINCTSSSRVEFVCYNQSKFQANYLSRVNTGDLN
jgi:hypothetical protein